MDGAPLARRFGQDRVKNSKYPVITFPSGLQRELWQSSDGGGIVNIFSAFELMRVGSRDEGFQQAIEFVNEYDYTVARRGESELLVFNPYSGRGYQITYDNRKRQIANVSRFPAHAMELLDIESRAILPGLYWYSGEESGLGLDAPAFVKFFTPDANWTWYVSEYDGEDTFFGLVAGFEVELGYFSYTELEGVRGRLGLPVERDLYFTPTSLRQLQQQHHQKGGHSLISEFTQHLWRGTTKNSQHYSTQHKSKLPTFPTSGCRKWSRSSSFCRFGIHRVVLICNVRFLITCAHVMGNRASRDVG